MKKRLLVRSILTTLLVGLISTQLYGCGGSSNSNPTVTSVRNAILSVLGNQPGFDALMIALAKGYSLQQIVDASLGGLLAENGDLLDGNGAVVTPSNPTAATVVKSLQRIQGELQILIESRIVTVNRSLFYQIGIEYDLHPIDVPIALSELGYSFNQIIEAQSGGLVLPNPDNNNYLQIYNESDLSLVLAALERQNAVQLSVSPSIPDSSDTGIQLAITPTVVEGDINADASLPAVLGNFSITNQGSERTQIQVGTPPSGILLSQSGSFDLAAGQSANIQVDYYNMSRTPVLGELPLIGRLFREDNSVKERKELVVFIKANIVENE